jgi:outer membrane biosynthesis protein TonB
VIGVNGIRLAGVVAMACLVLAGPAAAQSPDPDAAPPPGPDPAPSATHPSKPATAAPAQNQQPAPSQQAAPQTTPTPAEESPPVSGAVQSTPAPRTTSAPRRATHRAKRHKRASTTHLNVPALPRLTPAQLLASPSAGDDRARRMAIGAVALLLLALASATLVAITARFERRRMMR